MRERRIKEYDGYETKKLPDGKIELWYVGENVKTLHGVYQNDEELNQYRERLQKQDESDQFLSHTPVTGMISHPHLAGAIRPQVPKVLC